MQEQLTRQLIETVRTSIIDHVLAARVARIHLPASVVDILNSSVKDADTKFSQDVLLSRQIGCWRKRVVVCATKYNELASQPLRKKVENRLAQELFDTIYEQLALASQG